MSDLQEYYLRLYNLIESDVDIMLSEPDITKRSPKHMLELLKMAGQCQESIAELLAKDTDNDEWEKLSSATRKKIQQLIEDDVHNED